MFNLETKLCQCLYFKSVRNQFLNKINAKYLRTTRQKCDKPVISYKIVEPFERNDKKRLIADHILKPNYAKNGFVPKHSFNNLIKSDQQILAISNSCEIASKILTNVAKYLKVMFD
jgi:hypothetical protein